MADLLTQLYNAIDPSQPLPAGDDRYVLCEDVRGDTNILRDIGKEILLSDTDTCQLYTGHRGAGKSTELLRLKAHLEKRGCFVVHFAAIDEKGDLDQEDVQYTDILLACTRHLLSQLKDADPRPVQSWLRERMQTLHEIGQMELKMDSPAEIQAAFVKLTTAIRAVPTQRQEIRKQLNPHTVTLLDALNQFIADAKRKLPKDKTRLVVIADNLDRMVPIPQADGRTNHDEIYLDRSDQLKGLDCHLVYTVPISLVYSSRSSDLTNLYGTPKLLPMLMVRKMAGDVDELGLNRLKTLLYQRFKAFAADLALDTDIFADADTVNQLCLASGGHLRELLLLTKEAVKYMDALPISANAVRRATSNLRSTYRRGVGTMQWQVLAKVAISHRIQDSVITDSATRINSDDVYRDLLFRRYLLHYRDIDDQDQENDWYDVHPVIKAIPEFQEAVAQLQP